MATPAFLPQPLPFKMMAAAEEEDWHPGTAFLFFHLEQKILVDE